jgi:hypothetical protein
MTATLPLTITTHYVAITPESIGAKGRAFGWSVIEALEAGKRHVVVDCAAWRHLDFVLLSALVRCADLFSSRGALLELVNLSSELRGNIRELRLDERLGVAD